MHVVTTVEQPARSPEKNNEKGFLQGPLSKCASGVATSLDRDRSATISARTVFRRRLHPPPTQLHCFCFVLLFHLHARVPPPRRRHQLLGRVQGLQLAIPTDLRRRVRMVRRVLLMACQACCHRNLRPQSSPEFGNSNPSRVVDRGRSVGSSLTHLPVHLRRTYRVHGNQRQGYHEGGHSWRDAHAYLHWPVTAGQQMWGRSYSGCWNTWHSTNGNGAHSRSKCSVTDH